MKKVIIFGAGGMGQEIYEEIKNKAEVIAFWDNSAQENQFLKGIPVVKPHDKWGGYDEVILGACYPSMVKQCLELGISEDCINDKYVDRRISARIKFLECYANMAYKKKMPGCVAEAGVFQGEFAQHINRFFPDRPLFLFDTFTGFSEEDVRIECQRGLSRASIGQYSTTSEEIVMSKMEHPEQVLLRKGYFPASARGIAENFIFVNLDMDLYQPTLSGLNFFENKMNKNGVILVHDYFSHYRGVEQAVDEFLVQHENLQAIPIGDEISVAVLGF